MLLIDRYLLRQFVQSFLICFCSLTGLYIVIDAFANLDDFIVLGAKQGGLLRVISEYYGYRAISFFDRTSGILTLIAAMFTMAGFQRHNELTALMAAGITKWRIVQPVVGCVALIVVSTAVSRELLIPAIRHELSRDARDFDGEAAKDLQDPRRDHKTDILFRGRQTIAGKKQIKQPSFRLPIELSAHGNELAAEDAFYLTATDEHPAGYLMQGVKHPSDLLRAPSLLLDGEPVIITPRDAGWLKKDECFVASDVGFEQLVGGGSWRQFSSTAELMAGLRNSSLDYGADVRVTVHTRLIQPLLDMTLLFLGLPLVMSRQTRNMFLAAGLGIGVVIFFMLVVLAFRYAGGSSLINPALAAWCPLMIFVPAAVGMSESLRE